MPETYFTILFVHFQFNNLQLNYAIPGKGNDDR